jgi:hypothetical protein
LLGSDLHVCRFVEMKISRTGWRMQYLACGTN